MLYNIDPLLGPEMLSLLRAMGHGDEFVIADANFPAASHARRLVRVDGATGPALVEAVLSLCPLDSFVPHAAFCMQQEHDAATLAPVCLTYEALVKRLAGPAFDLQAIDRFAFYERARQAFAIFVTSETRLYGNLLLKKGIVRPSS